MLPEGRLFTMHEYDFDLRFCYSADHLQCLTNWEKSFDAIDVDNSGQLTLEELKEALKILNQDDSDTDINATADVRRVILVLINYHIQVMTIHVLNICDMPMCIGRV